MADRTAPRARPWLAPAVAAVCAALALGLAGAGLSPVLKMAGLLGLVTVAVVASLSESMNLRRERFPLRAVMLIPLVFSILATITLVVEGAYRAQLVGP